jgi:5-hydroxyisourate hydrolase
MSVSTHVLDTARGRPASGVPVTLSHRGPGGVWAILGSGVTDVDGRVRELSEGGLAAGVYRLDFNTAHYFEAHGTHGFYPEVSVVFTLPDFGEHLHVPLLLSPYGYATYKGT